MEHSTRFCPCGFIDSILFKSLYHPQGLHYQLPIHTTPFLHIQTHSGVLHKHGAKVTSFNPTCGSQPPHPQVGEFKLPQTWSVHRGVPSPLICSVILSITEIPMCEANAYILGHFMPIILANRVQFNVWGNYWHELTGLRTGYLRNGIG